MEDNYMTEIEKRILTTIDNYVKDNKIAPTVREISNVVGLKSSASVHRYLFKLEKKVYLIKEHNSPRNLRVVSSGVKVSKNILICSGEKVVCNGEETNMYLKYKIEKEHFHLIEDGIKEMKLCTDPEEENLCEYEFVYMIYNQLSEQITLKLCKKNEGDDDSLIETWWSKGEFFRIIYEIEK
jgi:repressor LexA